MTVPYTSVSLTGPFVTLRDLQQMIDKAKTVGIDPGTIVVIEGEDGCKLVDEKGNPFQFRIITSDEYRTYDD